MHNTQVLTFVGAIGALAVMTFLAVGIGQLLRGSVRYIYIYIEREREKYNASCAVFASSQRLDASGRAWC